MERARHFQSDLCFQVAQCGLRVALLPEKVAGTSAGRYQRGGKQIQVSSKGVSLASKHSKAVLETSSKQIEDMKALVARLKADLVDREKECSMMLSRAVDAEATCDQLRSELSKVMQVKNSNMMRSIDSTTGESYKTSHFVCFFFTDSFSVPGSESLDTTQSLSILLNGDDSQALKHKVLELQKENSTLRVSNAKLGRRITVALASVALSEKQTVAADEHDASFSAEDALLAHHQSEIAAAEAAVTISTLKREVRELRSKNSELQQHIDATGSSVSEVEFQFRDASSRLAEFQSLYVESDRRNQEILEQVSKEQLRYRQLEVAMVSRPFDAETLFFVPYFLAGWLAARHR